METPRTNPKVLPEIRFAGSLDVPASRASADPAVTAAFIAFHRSAGTDSLAPRRRYVNRGTIALAALAFLGFGGGLFLALFSFNSPEGSSSRVAAARPPEVIYTAHAASEAPQDGPAAPDYAVAGSADPIEGTLFALAAPAQAAPETSSWSDFSSEPSHSIAGAYASGSYASAGAPAFAGSTEPAAPAEGPNGLAASDISIGFDALTAAPVPEPSTWATMISGAGLLVLFGRVKRRRG